MLLRFQKAAVRGNCETGNQAFSMRLRFLTIRVAHCVRLVSSASIDSMVTLTIRQLDEKTKTRLRVRAAHHGRSMEEEAREILRSALRASPVGKQNLSETVRRRFAEFGGIELELPPRDAARESPKFGE
jgi:plasmid stability protein